MGVTAGRTPIEALASRSRAGGEGDLPIILTWNPKRWDFGVGEYERYIEQTHRTPPEAAKIAWSVGRRRHGVVVGDRAYLLRQGGDRRGIVASGVLASVPHPDDHWDGSGEEAWFVDVEWQRIVDPDDRLSTEELIERVPAVPWNSIFGSGSPVTGPEADAIDAIWEGRNAGQGTSSVTDAATDLEDRPQFAAEVSEDAIDLLRRLIGVPLTTLTGRSNRILGVTPPNVLVGTDRSSDGQPVPIQWVQDALDLLRTDGSVEIHPDSIRYRSSFIGAVLRTLPGARVYGSNPPTLTLARFDTTPDLGVLAKREEDSVPYGGSLSYLAESGHRGEQAALRRQLFGAQELATCALCGELYPLQFLYAAHIKRRSVCTENEKRDLSRIGMPACAFGCDALFEAGFVSVNSDGRIVISGAGSMNGALIDRLQNLADRQCLAYDAGRERYFEWHRKNRFRG